MQNNLSKDGVRNIPEMEMAVWKTVLVEDYSWKSTPYVLVKYSSDLMTLGVLEWEYVWEEIPVDLGISSQLDVMVRNIYLNWNKIFFEELIHPNNREAKYKHTPLDVWKVVEDTKLVTSKAVDWLKKSSARLAAEVRDWVYDPWILITGLSEDYIVDTNLNPNFSNYINKPLIFEWIDGRVLEDLDLILLEEPKNWFLRLWTDIWWREIKFTLDISHWSIMLAGISRILGWQEKLLENSDLNTEIDIEDIIGAKVRNAYNNYTVNLSSELWDCVDEVIKIDWFDGKSIRMKLLEIWEDGKLTLESKIRWYEAFPIDIYINSETGWLQWISAIYWNDGTKIYESREQVNKPKSLDELVKILQRSYFSSWKAIPVEPKKKTV